MCTFTGNKFTISKIVFLLLCYSSLSFSARHVTLPADEFDAASMLERHEIDSSLWEIVEPFYQQPISVPYGESGILMQLFPELDLDIPVSEESLARYSPWDSKMVAQFFKDYPELVFYKPILDFSMDVPVKSGRVCVSVDRNGSTGNIAQRLQFSLEPVTWLSADGRAQFTDYYARWKNRTVTISPQKWWSVTAGNNAPEADRHRLVSGRFGNRTSEINDIADNWLYGEKRGWNTITLNIASDKILNGVKVQSFLHKRFSESVAGISSQIVINNYIESEIDLIGMDMKELADTLLYGVFSTRINYSGWNTELTLGSTCKRSPTIPVRLDCDYIREMDEFNFECIYFPQGFNGSGSRSLTDLTGESDASELLTEDLLSYDLVWKHNVIDDITVRPSLLMKMSDFQMWYLNPGLFVSVEKKNYRLLFGYQRFEPLSDRAIRTKNDFSIECSLQPSEMVDLTVDLCARTFVNSSRYFSADLEPVLTLIPEMMISPGVKFKKYSNKPGELSLSFANTMYLFKSMYSDVSIEKYISFDNKKGQVSAHAKMWFVF